MRVCVREREREALRTVLMFETAHVNNKMEDLKRVTKKGHFFTMVTLKVNEGPARVGQHSSLLKVQRTSR